MGEVLISGKTSFKIEVPYKLVEVGEKGEKPLIVYLHGFGQNIGVFQDLAGELMNLRGYHLFIQGPYPIYDRSRQKKVEEWGRAWYLYDGEQPQFIRSLELSSEFIQEIIDGVLNHIPVSRLCLFGYSMGGYQAGYFALSRWKHVTELVVVGGRIKTEVFEEREHPYSHLKVLALHGIEDESVGVEPSKESAEQLREWGAGVTFKSLQEGHALTSGYIFETIEWLTTLGYTES